MNRFSIISALTIGAALGAGGCFAQNGEGDPGQSESDVQAPAAGTIHGPTSAAGLVGAAVRGGASTPLDRQAGPQPDPWSGFTDLAAAPGGGPQPDPWKPRACIVSEPAGGQQAPSNNNKNN
jgi:hypothetical protein